MTRLARVAFAVVLAAAALVAQGARTTLDISLFDPARFS